jgi:acetolactate synthase I/III small subunit
MALSHAISVLLDDDLLTFNRVIGVVRRRNVPIASIAAGASQVPGVSRLTFIMQADEASADRLVQQLRKSFGVREAAMFPADDAVTREIALVKVRTTPANRADLRAVVSEFDAAVVDEAAGACIVEIAGAAARTDSCIQALTRFGIVEIARSGAVAMLGAAGSAPSPTPQNPSEVVL